MSAFPQKSRIFIEKRNDGVMNAITNISINAAFSKMDSHAYPLLQLYCEDELAEFIIRKMLIEINTDIKYFDRLINIIKSGPINEVKNDYERHKRNYKQMNLKMGFACVFDGDYKDNPKYSSYHENPNEFSFFLFPFTAPEKFLLKAYLSNNSNPKLQNAFENSDHHALFQEMVNEGLSANRESALEMCWNEFITKPEFSSLYTDFREFILKTTRHFSECNE